MCILLTQLVLQNLVFDTELGELFSEHIHKYNLIIYMYIYIIKDMPLSTQRWAACTERLQTLLIRGFHHDHSKKKSVPQSLVNGSCILEQGN